VNQAASNKTGGVGGDGGQSSSSTFKNGMRVALSTPGAILMASSAGFGALANDAGMSLFNAIFMMAVFFALPAQVVMMDQLARGGSIIGGALAVALTGVRLVPMMVTIMPLLGKPRSALPRRLAAAHFVAITAWLEGLRHLPKLPEHRRMTFFLGIGTGMVTATLVGTALGFELAESVPPAISAGLLFLTPIYFFLSLMAAARLTMDWLAIVIGALLGPPLYVVTPGLDLLFTGLIGGTVAYVAGRRFDGILEEEE
jgi:predicted branched-subunit amino acid permease